MRLNLLDIVDGLSYHLSECRKRPRGLIQFYDLSTRSSILPRPTSKTQLLHAAESGMAAMEELLAGLTTDQLAGQFDFEHRDRCVRDVLGHLYHWHRLFNGWYKSGMAGKTPLMPAEGFTWKSTPQLNELIREQCQMVALSVMRRKLQQSHRKLIDLIELHSNEELFVKQHYPWTGSTSLGSYLTSATSAHYAWALKVLKQHAKRSQHAR